MYITLIILFLSAIFFMSGKVRSDLVALCALVTNYIRYPDPGRSIDRLL